jgi:hypothetical protein
VSYWQGPGMQQHGDAKKGAEKGRSHFLTIVDLKTVNAAAISLLLLSNFQDRLAGR